MPVGASQLSTQFWAQSELPSKHLMYDYAKYIFFMQTHSILRASSAVEGLDHTDGLRFALRLPDAKASVLTTIVYHFSS